MTESEKSVVTVYGRNSEGDSTDFPGYTIALHLQVQPSITTRIQPLSLRTSREELNETLREATFADLPKRVWPITVLDYEYEGTVLLFGNTVQTRRDLEKYLEHSLGEARVTRIYGTADQVGTGALAELVQRHPELLEVTYPVTEDELSQQLGQVFGSRVLNLLPFAAFPIFVIEKDDRRYLAFGSDKQTIEDLKALVPY